VPRILDMFDAGVGRTPELLDTGVDYLTQRPGPTRLIGSNGHYNAGWLSSFDGQLNLRDSDALDLSFQRWFHLAFDAPKHFIVCNLANLTRASNCALLVVDKATGAFEHVSLTHLRPTDTVRHDDALRHFHDDETGSFIRTSADLSSVHVCMRTQHLSFLATARHALGPPMVQCTRFQRGRGVLQWYRILELQTGLLAVGDRVFEIPAGTLATSDRTVGHMRGIQAWNWVAAVGYATEVATGQRVRIGLQIARDRAGARPVVEAKKYVVWLEDSVHKLPTARFDYELLDEDNETGPWRIVSEGDQALELDFVPRYHRREKRHLMLVNADFNQYYGMLSGRVTVDGRRFELEPCFAVTEQSLLEL
jgi:hypothetical protein